MRFHATTACLPGIAVQTAVLRLLEGLNEPVLGTLSTDHVQLCPQTPGQIDEAMCDTLREMAPTTRFRLHANARVHDKHVLWDASTVNDGTWEYFKDLSDRSRRLNAPAYVLHAGRKANSSREGMADNVRRLNDLFGIPVGVEALYPLPRDPQLLDCWADYAWLLDQDIPYAIDLSHVQIIARAEGVFDAGLVAALLASPRCIEVHVSDNDHRRDEHRTLEKRPPWFGLLASAHDQAVVFSEGNQLRRAPAANRHQD